MSVDPVTISAAAPKIGPASTPTEDTGSFPATLASIRPATAPSETPATITPRPTTEVSRAALPGGGNRLGDTVLSHLGRIHQGDFSVRSPLSPANRPVSVSTVLPQGPAAGPLAPTKAGKPEEPDGFEVQLKNLKEMYDQAVQVSLMTKSTGALNGTVNKLMSAQ